MGADEAALGCGESGAEDVVGAGGRGDLPFGLTEAGLVDADGEAEAVVVGGAVEVDGGGTLDGVEVGFEEGVGVGDVSAPPLEPGLGGDGLCADDSAGAVFPGGVEAVVAKDAGGGIPEAVEFGSVGDGNDGGGVGGGGRGGVASEGEGRKRGQTGGESDGALGVGHCSGSPCVGVDDTRLMAGVKRRGPRDSGC